MSIIQPRCRAVLAASISLLIATVTGAGQLASAASTPISVEAITEVRGAASGLARARRLSIDATIPIFPMQVKPRCYILDNFGEPRGLDRIHQGTDIMATLGQEVYAVVDGTLGHQVIVGGPDSSLSGNGWRLTAANSKTWYVFMHLSGFAPGLADGSVVRQGQLIGYVGDTGNPGPGNYHLHFEVHPNGGSAVNALTVLTVPLECTVQ